jgi:hypothetical protein
MIVILSSDNQGLVIILVGGISVQMMQAGNMYFFLEAKNANRKKLKTKRIRTQTLHPLQTAPNGYNPWENSS